MTKQVPSKDMSKPERNNYPPGYFGDREYLEALTVWHREQFGHAQTGGPADGLCGIKGCTKPWRHPGDCAHGGESTYEPAAPASNSLSIYEHNPALETLPQIKTRDAKDYPEHYTNPWAKCAMEDRHWLLDQVERLHGIVRALNLQLNEQRPSDEPPVSASNAKLAQELRDWYDAAWINSSQISERHARLLWSAIQALTVSSSSSRLDRIGALLDKLPKGEGLRYYHAGRELLDAREALQALRAEFEPPAPASKEKLGGIDWLKATAQYGSRKADKEGATALLGEIERLRQELAESRDRERLLCGQIDRMTDEADSSHEPACEYEQDGFRIETDCGDVFHLNASEDPPDHCGKCGKVLTVKSQSQPPPAATSLCSRTALDEFLAKYWPQLELRERSEVPPQSAIALIADDAYAATFQSMGQYRAAILGSLRTPPPRDVIRSRAFWSDGHTDLITAYVSADDITLMDDNGHIYEPAGNEVRHGPSPTKGDVQS